MLAEVRKLHLIEEVLKINNEDTLSALETILTKSSVVEEGLKSPFTALSGIWSKEEADEIAKTIDDNCRQINLNDWK